MAAKKKVKEYQVVRVPNRARYLIMDGDKLMATARREYLLNDAVQALEGTYEGVKGFEDWLEGYTLSLYEVGSGN